MSNGLVQIAYLHPHKVSHSWHLSMMQLVAWDAAHDCRVLGTKGPFMIRADSGGLVAARNLAVKQFLDDTPHEWLWFIDTDQGFAADTVDRLLEAADPVERPVIGALCFGLWETEPDGLGGCRVRAVPTIYRQGRDKHGNIGFSTDYFYEPNTLMQVAGTGAACLLIHRGALEKVRAEHGDAWFDQVRYQDGRLVSEDLSFMYRLAAVGVPVFVHTGIPTNHHKSCWIGPEDYSRPTLPSPAEMAEAAKKDLTPSL